MSKDVFYRGDDVYYSMEKAIDKLLSSFDYVREIGRGRDDNHIGIELTVDCTACPVEIDDEPHREAIKQFLLRALESPHNSTVKGEQ